MTSQPNRKKSRKPNAVQRAILHSAKIQLFAVTGDMNSAAQGIALGLVSNGEVDLGDILLKAVKLQIDKFRNPGGSENDVDDCDAEDEDTLESAT